MQEQGRLEVLRRHAAPPSNGSGNGSQERSTPGAAAVPLPARRWKTRVLVPGLVVGAAAAILAFAAGGALRPAVPVKIVPAVAKAGVQNTVGTAVVQAPGWVEPDPYPIAISALADGVIREVPVLEGQPVKKGQVVARLVTEDAQLALNRAEARLGQRKAELATAQALLTEAERTWDQPIELRRKLATAEASLAEKQAELARWPAEVEAEKARLAEMDAELKRQEQLRGYNAEKDYTRAQRARQAQTAVLQGVEGKRPILEAQVKAAQAEAEAARQALELRIPERRAVDEGKSRVAQAEAALKAAEAVRDEAKLRLDRMEVRSPVDGVVMARLVQPGSKLMLNGNEMLSAQVMRLYSPSQLQVRVDVPLGDAAHVRLGQQAEVVVNVLPDKTFEGRVTRVVHEADIQKNTLQVKVAIQKPSEEIKPEMLTRVKFLAAPTTQPGGGGQEVIFAPANLIKQQNGHGSAWLVDQTRGVAESRHVMVGAARMGDWIEVREGLRAGDWLIVDPPGYLKAGARVRVTGEAPSSSGHNMEGM